MRTDEVILGVDTHLNVHVGALLSSTGKCLGTLSVTTDADGYLKLLTWAASFGPLHRAGVEALVELIEATVRSSVLMF